MQLKLRSKVRSSLKHIDKIYVLIFNCCLPIFKRFLITFIQKELKKIFPSWVLPNSNDIPIHPEPMLKRSALIAGRDCFLPYLPLT